MFDVRCLSFVGRCSLRVLRWLVVRCLMSVVWSSVLVVCRSLFAVCCLLGGAYWLLLVV